MRLAVPRVLRKDLAAIVVAVLSGLGPAAELLAAPAQKHVLAVLSMRRETQFAVLTDHELPRLLQERVRDVDYYSEYIDVARFPDPDYQAGLRDYFKVKYDGRRFDAVIAFQDVAAQFVERYRGELFGNAPVVFLAANPPRAPNSTGVRLNFDVARTVTLATALQPDVNRVFVVTGASARDRYYEGLARAQLEQFEGRLTFTYLAGLSTSELEGRLAMLPERSIALYVLMYQDARGINLDPLDYCARLTNITNRPIYSWTDSTMGRGVVGGAQRSAESQIHMAASQTLRVLGGEAAGSIPISSPDLYVNQVDWRQLQRWEISPARVPVGTVLRFREPGAWERYKQYILGAAALIVLQTALIGGLLIQGRRRRKAEDQVRRTQEQLRASYERIQDLGGRLIVAQEAERSRIARELHDDVSQQMAVVVVDVELLRRAAGQTSEQTDLLARETLDRVNEIARTVHDISHRLHPAKLRLIGLVPALAGLARELSTDARAVSFAADDVPEALPHDLTLCLYRIAQEALQNAIKHGGARQVSMRVSGGAEGVTLAIADDGVGFDVAAVGEGLGLISMNERAESFGGTLTIDSRPGAGTRVEATLPFVATSIDGGASAMSQPA